MSVIKRRQNIFRIDPTLRPVGSTSFTHGLSGDALAIWRLLEEKPGAFELLGELNRSPLLRSEDEKVLAVLGMIANGNIVPVAFHDTQNSDGSYTVLFALDDIATWDEDLVPFDTSFMDKANKGGKPVNRSSSGTTPPACTCSPIFRQIPGNVKATASAISLMIAGTVTAQAV